MVRVSLSKSGSSDILMENAIVPYDKSVNAENYFQVNPGIRRYRNVVMRQRQTGRADCIGNV